MWVILGKGVCLRWKGVPARGHIILLVSFVNEIMTENMFYIYVLKQNRLPGLLSAKPRHEKGLLSF